jgi:hypothetical protein
MAKKRKSTIMPPDVTFEMDQHNLGEPSGTEAEEEEDVGSEEYSFMLLGEKYLEGRDIRFVE